MKTDKQIKDIADRLNAISNNGNGNGNGSGTNGHDDNDDEFQDYDDEYYLPWGSEPLRFAYYRGIRIEQCDDEYRKKNFLCVYDTITQDELDYYLKRKLRVSPEQRYQNAKENIPFHELYYLKQTVDDNTGKCVDIAKEYGCGYNNGGCVPECRYYLPYGRIEDDEVIAEHKEWEEEHRKRNTIVNIDIDKRDFLEFAKAFYNR